MSETSGWAEDDGAWAAASGVVGWITDEEIHRVRALEDVVAELERRRRELDAEVSGAIEAGRAEGLRLGAAELAAELEALRVQRETLTRRCANAVGEAVEAVVGQLAARDLSAAVDLVMAGVAARDGRSVERVRVSPSLVEPVGRALGESVDVVADERLGAGDAVVETRDGKVERRIADLVEAMLPVVTAHLEGCDE